MSNVIGQVYKQHLVTGVLTGDSCDLYMTHGKLQIALELYNFVNHQVLPGTNISIDHFWKALDDIVHDLTPRNQALLKKT